MGKVIRAKSVGFCYGVKRAIGIVEDLVERGEGPIYTLGPIIHNSHVINSLKDRGVRIVESIEELPPGDGVVVLRAHGVERWVEERLKDMGFKVEDATCPFVKRVHDACQTLESEGFYPIIVGEKGHAEVRGIMSYVSQCDVVGGSRELESLFKRLRSMGVEKVGIVSQTTQPVEVFLDIVGCFVREFKDVRVVNTICLATRRRQDEARELSTKADVMLVVGDGRSRNTRKLYEICKSINPRTYFVESHRDVDPRWFTFCQVVGITAGASTPDHVIGQVEEEVKRLIGGDGFGDHG